MSIEGEFNKLGAIIRTGIVSSVDVSNRTVRVIFRDKSDMVSGPLKIVMREHGASAWLPNINQAVLCLYLPDGGSDGFVLGGI